MTNIVMIGSLNNAELLAGVGLGAMLLNVCWFAFTQGLNGTLETYISQLYGAQEYKLCGIYFNRAKAILFLVLAPVAILFWHTDTILIQVG
jgi:MATE family multidrug resistance protein